MTEAEFRARLLAMGITLDDKAFAAAWKGARHLQGEMARIDAYLKAP
jgi:hypothetical protein